MSNRMVLYWRFCCHQTIFILLAWQMMVTPNRAEYSVPLIVAVAVNGACCVLAMEGR